jgi:hypothetical protein
VTPSAGPVAAYDAVVGKWHLAQVNVARLRGPIDSEELRTFVELLEPINALADEAPGFVWRLQASGGDATSIRAFEDDLIIVNVSVWESLHELRDYVFRSRHGEVLRRRSEWMERTTESHLAMWWVRAGETPKVDDAVARLRTIRERGPSRDAFTFREVFEAPVEDVTTTV